MWLYNYKFTILNNKLMYMYLFVPVMYYMCIWFKKNHSFLFEVELIYCNTNIIPHKYIG